jgi:hypothetical protein
MTAPERLTLTDADLRLLLREGCSESELACAVGLELPAMHLRLDHARDIVGPDFDA